jgi:predicted aspartyl protease
VGTFFYPITLIAADGRRVEVEALIDTGASFTSMPADVLRDLGVAPVRQARLRLSDGSTHVQQVGEVRAEIDGAGVTTLVVFGEAGSPPAIGAYTLEGLLLGVDPVDKRLVPVEGWLAVRA